MQLDDYHCLFCSNHEEEASYTFFGCQRIMSLWWESLAWTEVVTVFLASPREHFLQHSYCKASGIVQNRWWIWWAALTWCIWNHRNRIVFSNEDFNGQKLMEDTIFFCWTWLRYLDKDFELLFLFWSSNIKSGFLYRGGIRP